MLSQKELNELAEEISERRNSKRKIYHTCRTYRDGMRVDIPYPISQIRIPDVPIHMIDWANIPGEEEENE